MENFQLLSLESPHMGIEKQKLATWFNLFIGGIIAYSHLHEVILLLHLNHMELIGRGLQRYAVLIFISDNLGSHILLGSIILELPFVSGS